MDIHDQFQEWAVSVAHVDINGIAAHKFPGRGLGIIAQKSFKTGETLLKVPISSLRTIQTVPKVVSQACGDITTHGVLAAELCLDTPKNREEWNAVLPSPKDFQESVPLMWHADLQTLLPEAAKALLENQKTKLKLDWDTVSKAFPEIDYENYLYRWLIVNTRTFYYLDPKSKKNPARDDCMALNPFADYFNHAGEGCHVEFSKKGYTITANKPIRKGSEIYISYGNHSNDFLLAEYGFIMEENQWDEICLDQYILPMLSEKQKSDLEDAGFLGKYILDKNDVCYRTQVALMIIVLPPRKWRRFVDGMDESENFQEAVDQCLLKALKLQGEDVKEKIVAVSKIEVGLACQRDTLSRRWKQIDLLLKNAIQRIS